MESEISKVWSVFLDYLRADNDNLTTIWVALLIFSLGAWLATREYRRQKRDEALNRRAELYAEAIRAIEDYMEAPYMALRANDRSDSKTQVIMRINEIQSRLNLYKNLFKLHGSSSVRRGYEETLKTMRSEAGSQIRDAWKRRPPTHNRHMSSVKPFSREKTDKALDSLLESMRADLGQSKHSDGLNTPIPSDSDKPATRTAPIKKLIYWILAICAIACVVLGFFFQSALSLDKSEVKLLTVDSCQYSSFRVECKFTDSGALTKISVIPEDMIFGPDENEIKVTVAQNGLGSLHSLHEPSQILAGASVMVAALLLATAFLVLSAKKFWLNALVACMIGFILGGYVTTASGSDLAAIFVATLMSAALAAISPQQARL